MDALLGPGDWSLEPAAGGGSAGRSWVARDGHRRFFVKRGVNAELLRWLAELDVAPAVVASDSDGIVHEFVDGVSPTPRWIDENIDAVGALIQRYRDAAAVREVVPPLSRVDYVSQLSSQLALRENSVLANAFDAIAHDTFAEDTTDLTLTHGDPNTSNFIVRRDGRLCLIDWDEARASDPLRDIGPLVWWYVQPNRWHLAVAAAGFRSDDATRERMLWWAAARSIDVALWLTEHGQRDTAATFAVDAQAAARGLPNPRGWWAT